MGEYAVGAATKERIMYCCEALFYEKGIHDTSYDDICQEAKINRGLIPYYFKSKHNVASNIFIKLLQNIEQAATEFCKPYGISYSELTIVIELFMFDMMQRDAKLCRFYSSIMSGGTFYDTALQEQYNYLRHVALDNNLVIDERVFRTILIMAQGTEMELVHSISTGYLLESVPEFVPRDIMTMYSMLGINRRKISEWTTRALEITKGYQMVSDHHFNCAIIESVD